MTHGPAAPVTTSTPGRATPHKLTPAMRAAIIVCREMRWATVDQCARWAGISHSRVYAVVKEWRASQPLETVEVAPGRYEVAS